MKGNAKEAAAVKIAVNEHVIIYNWTYRQANKFNMRNLNKRGGELK